MKSLAPVVEPPLHGTPREGVLAVESPQRLEIGDLDHRSHLGVEVEMQETGRRRGALDVGERGPGRIDQFVSVLVHIRREQEEFVVLDAESAPWLPDAALAQDNELPAFTELATDHGPLLQRDVIDGLHRG
jgi:hypothetical protein